MIDSKSEARDNINILTGVTAPQSTTIVFTLVSIEELYYLVNTCSLFTEDQRFEYKSTVLDFVKEPKAISKIFGELISKEIAYLQDRLAKVEDEYRLSPKDPELKRIITSIRERLTKLQNITNSSDIFNTHQVIDRF